MNVFNLEHLCFTYPEQTEPALKDIRLTIHEGEFILLCGMSGCGKTTLLRQLKPALTPHGKHTGTISYWNSLIQNCTERTLASEIGYVMQSPEEQIVTDKVWHELAFGLESLGYDTQTIRLRTAEMASFFGIEAWFHQDTARLSGGQKQLLNLASIMAMQPKVLLLDEPTSQLDPIAAADFLAAVKKINTELGVTVVLIEQRLQDAFQLADRVVVMEEGKILADAAPRQAGAVLINRNHPMTQALPAPMRIYGELDDASLVCPMTVREGRQWLGMLFHENAPQYDRLSSSPLPVKKEEALRLSECWFRYEKEEPDALQNLSLTVPKSELYCIVGGNGTGKSTALKLIAGICKPYRGKVKVNGKTALLPQNPQSLFLKSSVSDDLHEVLDQKLPEETRKKLVQDIANLVGIGALLERHPYDLSGGEQQRAALAKVLLTKPEILLLDEPTKGLDAFHKKVLAGILRELLCSGMTVVMVSHDVEFCAEHADECALFFNGSVISEGSPRDFFAGNSFYTTAASRMTRGWFANTVTNGDVIELCKKNLK